MTTIHTIRQTLSDRSHAWGIRLIVEDQAVDIDCLDERSADRLSQAILDAINLYGAQTPAFGDEIHTTA